MQVEHVCESFTFNSRACLNESKNLWLKPWYFPLFLDFWEIPLNDKLNSSIPLNIIVFLPLKSNRFQTFFQVALGVPQNLLFPGEENW